jgi:hypothetical protein
MEIINRYFGKIIFVKADYKEDHTIYIAALSSSFQDGKKQYALAFVPSHLAIISQGFLSDLQWVNLQTRTMINGYRMRPQRWEIPKGLDNPMFTAVERSETRTKYRCDSHLLEMVLIHDPKKKSKLQYHTTMNLLAALATFKCAISLIDPPTPPVFNPTSWSSPNLGPGMSSYLPPRGYANTSIPRTEPTPVSNDYNGGVYSAPGGTRSTEAEGKYTNIGLLEYTIPQVPTAPQKKGEVRREMISRPYQGQEIDSSFELI